MKQAIKDKYIALSRLMGVSGFEQEIVRYCRDILRASADKVEVTTTGNLIATYVGKRQGHSFMLSAHVDEVGYIVKNITDDGFLLFERVGNPVAKTMSGLRLRLRGTKGDIVGVIGLTPGHIQTPEEARTVATSKTSYIDVGARSAAEVAQMGLSIGCVGIPESPVVTMYNPDLLMGRAADDRLGCAVLLQLAEALADRDFAGTLHLVFSVQEEIGVVGAKQVTRKLDPDYCLVLDTFPAGGTPDVPPRRLPVIIGGGPVISIMDTLVGPMTCGYVTNARLVEAARRIAAEEGFSLQTITMCEDGYGTDAIGITNEGSHAPCLSLGLPRRYSHSPNEVVDLNDAEKMVRLLLGMVKGNETLDLSFIED
ncbi:MAG: M20/M25/M40 family metallo-hydrolase [Christensenellaceae bacterium]|nr:M20/M25/M40 family metallo-hydrolase [Christensenellaceae bacterium]